MNQQEWIFGNPGWLWVIPVLLLLGPMLWHFWRKEALRRLACFVSPRLFATAIPSVHWRGRAGHFASAIAILIFLALALARPLRGPLPEFAENRGVDFVIALDVSKSMWAEDVKPNRLQAVKSALEEWFPKLRGDRVGLVLFAGEAFTQAPITHDLKALNYVLQQAGPRSISLGGTNIPAAIENATRLLQSTDTEARSVVLISDGENLEGNALDAVRQARARDGLTVFTVGVGTPTGAQVPAQDFSKLPPGDNRRRFVGNEYGLGVTSRLDSRMLRLLAEAGGGRYYEFKPGMQTFETLRNQSLLPLAEKSRALNVREYQEWFQIPLACAILLLMLQALIPQIKRRKIEKASGVAVIMPETLSAGPSPRTLLRARKAASSPALKVLAALLLAAAATQAETPAPATPWDEADRLLQEKKAGEAVELMRQAVQQSNQDPWLLYNYAMTLYRADRFEEAVIALESLRQSPEGAQFLEKAALQMANAQVRLGEKLQKGNQLPGTILALERALNYYDESGPKGLSREAKHNRELAEGRLEECLMTAGKHYQAAAERQAGNLPQEETNLRNALQAFERVSEIREKNPEAPKLAEKVREQLAETIAKQAANLSKQADASAANSKKRPEEGLSQRQQAIDRLDEALSLAPKNAAIQEQKKSELGKMSDQLTRLAEQQMGGALEKSELNAKDQLNLSEAKAKLDQALGFNPDNQKAQQLAAQAGKKLEQSYVEEGQKALANLERMPEARSQLNQALKASDQFQKALELNAENQVAKEGLEKANTQLPELFAAAGDAEAKQAQETMKGKNSEAPAQSDLQKAVGFLEKADQNYGMATSMAPQNAGLQQRADKVRQMLGDVRDQLDQMNRATAQKEAAENAEQMAQSENNSGEQSPASQPGEQPLSMVDLGSRAKPKTGDNFWEKRIRDW